MEFAVTTLDSIKTEYLAERKTYHQLTGSLYPTVVYLKLQKLREEYEKAGGLSLDLPYTPPPDPYGYVPPFNL